ncbi:MAG TPA: Fic family protein [Baekduia sp.]|uniref:Fic family protein n=1 Tax=Baekduia sp. TaxID=2600305 RepID=UPI002D78860C|nr:Fic family protein [Baekduia sp.]HET6508163.1 Fic family protein [Baekduia sp.]
MTLHVAQPPDSSRALSLDRFLAITQAKLPAGYPHWDKLRHLDPPDGLTSEEWWAAVKLGRTQAARTLPLRDRDGVAFTYTTPDLVLRALHLVDQRCAGEIRMPEVVTGDAQAKRQYLVNSLMEEAIRSSQLEGASTSRRVAKELLRTGRRPKDRSELMIVNNYMALQYMRESMGDRLRPADVLELQRILNDGTLDDPSASGRLQTPDEPRVAVVDRIDGGVLHRPPPADQLPSRLQALCDFANGDSDDEDTFIHPVVRAILLHFWLAYDHPFEDGNGRTARVLFSWFMRTKGYWLVEYLSISKILREAPGRYNRAFLLTETDHGDTTYFIIHQLGVIERAIDELHKYLRRKVAEVRGVERLLRGASGFNHRQTELLGGALRDGDRVYTFTSHANAHGVTHETARTDLRDLADRGLLTTEREGRLYRFHPAPDLAAQLEALGATVAPG